VRIGILLPHVFAQQKLMDKVVFTPVTLAIDLVVQLSTRHEVFFFTPGPVGNNFNENVQNISVDMGLLEEELQKQKCTLPQLITKCPLAFTSLSRSVQAELTAKAFELANSDKLDILHIFMCESEVPLYFSNLLKVPVVFTHHDPFNFYRKYRVNFPKLMNLNYVSISKSQRETAPKNMNFVANVYNGINLNDFDFRAEPELKDAGYFASIGRIIQNKGVHTAIDACKNTGNALRFAGKYYSSKADKGQDYWSKHIKPHVDNKQIIYEGFISDVKQKSGFLGGAKALLFPIEWMEPFGVVIIEAMACGTPVIAFPGGAVEEIIQDGVNGYVVSNQAELEKAMGKVQTINRRKCREYVEQNYTIEIMAKRYEKVYEKLCK